VKQTITIESASGNRFQKEATVNGNYAEVPRKLNHAFNGNCKNCTEYKYDATCNVWHLYK